MEAGTLDRTQITLKAGTTVQINGVPVTLISNTPVDAHASVVAGISADAIARMETKVGTDRLQGDPQSGR